MKKGLTVLLAIVLISTLSACSSLSVFRKEITVTDDMGREVNLPKAAERIVSLAPTNTEFLFALGLGDKTVGVTDWCNFPQEVSSKEKVGGFSKPSVEKIVSLKPDLVVAASLHKDVVEQLEILKIPVIVLNAKSISEVLANADLLGKVTGAGKAADEVKSRINTILKQVDDKVKTLSAEQKPVVYYEVWHDPIMTAGPNTFINELLTRAGGINLAVGAPTNYPTYSLEELLARQPEVMFYGHAVETVEQVLARTNWSSIPAIGNARVYLVNEDLILRAGPRIGEGLLELAKHLHPGLWK
ncbi:MAG: iron complex transport system substrate-binding protein [Bacillota bacterium]|nr:MAG: iron complex transport system substrate-binding protein [Bacillota bacterium]MBS3950349.1 cobalamin-binding protein [Peptococcaceae bacterium]